MKLTGTRVVYCDTANNKLLWKAALERALALDAPIRPKRGWWATFSMFLQELFG